jgi:stearoyl-CoA desaturase (Delta-9 desaturase)
VASTTITATTPPTPAPAPPPAASQRDRSPEERTDWASSIPFALAHLAPLAAIFTGVTARSLILLFAVYGVRMFFITAGYHRYFSHRSYRLGRVMQAIMAFGGTTAAQKGPLWWAANHRAHHRYADTDRDPHSPIKGLWWSHVGWILSYKHKGTDLDVVRDLARYPELRFIDKYNWIGPWGVGLMCFLVGGWSGLVVGFFGSTVLLWHVTFLVNSAAHLVGRRRYDTNDTSKNNWVIALLTNGEGWHNNHHRFPAAARQGFFWWELDISYYVLRLLSVVGLARELRSPPAAVLAEGRGPRS